MKKSLSSWHIFILQIKSSADVQTVNLLLPNLHFRNFGNSRALPQIVTNAVFRKF